MTYITCYECRRKRPYSDSYTVKLPTALHPWEVIPKHINVYICSGCAEKHMKNREEVPSLGV